MVRKETEAKPIMLIIIPTRSLWRFLVVSSKAKGDNARLFLDYPALNKRMKAGIFPLPKIEEVVDARACSKLFRNMYMFGGDCQNTVARNVRESTVSFCKLESVQSKLMLYRSMNASFSFQGTAERLFK